MKTVLSRNKSPESSVITIRIDKDLNEHLDKMKTRLGLSKADLIRNYLEMSRYMIKQKNTLKSLNERDFIVIKRSFLRKILESVDEEKQIQLGDKLSRFVNDIARITGNIEDTHFKLYLCDNLGFFRKFIDEENYVLITKKFGPKKFAEAFLYRLFAGEEMDIEFTEEGMKGNRSKTQSYNREFKSVERSASHYSYAFTRIEDEE
jgi:hypothetical protein